MNYTIAIHGGAGTILKARMTPAQQQAYLDALRASLRAGNTILKNGGTALDAVEAAVVLMEDCPLFNAGRGSVFTHDGRQEMEAAIMCGRTLDIGAVTHVSKVRNPIRLSRKILEISEHVILSGEGAIAFGREQQVAFEEEDWFYDDYRYQQWQKALAADQVVLDHAGQKFGTVGAVALDPHGHLAAATSTGGMTNKKYGRIGDSPLPGCGTYANDRTCAISCTGHGEFYIRGVVAYDVSCLMEYGGYSLAEACQKVIHEKQPALGGSGGLIAVDNKGNMALPFNSEGMYRGWAGKDEEQVAIW
ncbi:MAG: isoaspartyl peptidase/L-asparaginase [Saprospiraceae bacterium]